MEESGARGLEFRKVLYLHDITNPKSGENERKSTGHNRTYLSFFSEHHLIFHFSCDVMKSQVVFHFCLRDENYRHQIFFFFFFIFLGEGNFFILFLWTSEKILYTTCRPLWIRSGVSLTSHKIKISETIAIIFATSASVSIYFKLTI